MYDKLTKQQKKALVFGSVPEPLTRLVLSKTICAPMLRCNHANPRGMPNTFLSTYLRFRYPQPRLHICAAKPVHKRSKQLRCEPERRLSCFDQAFRHVGCCKGMMNQCKQRKGSKTLQNIVTLTCDRCLRSSHRFPAGRAWFCKGQTLLPSARQPNRLHVNLFGQILVDRPTYHMFRSLRALGGQHLQMLV